MKFPLSRQKRQIIQFFGLFCCCCVLIISCGELNTSTPTDNSASSVTSVSSSERIAVGSVAKPRTLDPADGYEVAISDIITSLGDRLYTYAGDTDKLLPQLATELPQVSDDGLTYTIPLRQGVTFHDETPFNAEAMAFSLKRFSENGGKPSALLSNIMESVEATGEYELTIKLKNAFAPFPYLLAFPGLSAVSPQAYEIGQGKFKPNEFVGTGPYKLVSFEPNLVKVDVFDDYWGEKPPNQGIDFQFLSSPANLYNSFTTGALDIAYRDLDADQILSLKEDAEAKGYQVLEKPSSRLDYIVLNVKQKPLDQVEVRQAIAALVDRALIIDRVYRGQAEPAYSIIPKTFATSKPVFKEPYGDGNVEKAKELLTQAGFSAENPFEFEIWYSSDSPQRQQIVTLLKEYAEQKMDGLMQVKPQPVESTTLFANIPKGIYPSYLVAWFPDFGDADNYVSPFFSCTKGTAETGCQEGASQSQGFFYYSEKMNQLIDAQRKEQDPQARQELFGQIQELIAQDVPLVPLLQKKEFAFAQKSLENVEINPIIGVSFWQVDKSA
ncbi:MAG: ABC transporter substrate-binding protein [Coleofasciculus sp. G3-WIS-01]|uniref:ABC transporter substrate-binding protein n=1 Tax=Coleofasciculus sp. G3-WIS-01 TaxID=3069528 RepID=UPI003301D449